MNRLNLKVDPHLGTPPFEQIRQHLAKMITSGQLLPQEKLPSIRQLAQDLDVAPGTVARAYSDLEASGLIESRPRLGSRVAASTSASSRLSEAAHQFISEAQAQGLDLAESKELLSRLWD